MPTALQTPLSEGQAEKVGKRLYRKQVLPVGHVDHDGKRLDFTPAYLKQLADSFTAGKMDQVPLILVGDDNRHSQDPEKVRGDVQGFEVQDDGLYMLAQLDERGDQMVRDNPKLGVSARINQENKVIEHVAATVNPVVKGMKTWEALDLSADENVLDLTDSEFVKSSDSAVSPQEVSTDALSAEDTKSLKALAARLRGKDASDSESLSDEDIQKLLNPDAETEGSKENEPVAALSKEAQEKIDLANSTAQKATEKADKVADDLAAEKWKNTEREYLDAGVPPATLKLAKPHLATSTAIVELSNTDSMASAMKRMLDEAKGTVELAERGRSVSDDEDSDENQAKELAKDEAWEKV